MKKLKEAIEQFYKELNQKELKDSFKELAVYFLYGGYIRVRNNYKIYIRTIEFYCHAEEDSKLDRELYNDPIVYHRNNRFIEGDVPYFPLLSFHAHASGFDITFENEELKLRTSALVRAYNVYDVQAKKWLVYDTKVKKFKESQSKSSKEINTQSTYLYNFLNGFGANDIAWVDEPNIEVYIDLQGKPRKNIYKYDSKFERTNEKDDRQWNFTREEVII